MTKKSVAKNYIYNVLYEILAIIIPLITTPYLSSLEYYHNGQTDGGSYKANSDFLDSSQIGQSLVFLLK